MTGRFTKAITTRVAGWLLPILLVMTALSCKRQNQAISLPPPIVAIIELSPTNVPLSTEFIGQLDSPKNVEVRARVEGFLAKMLFEEGKAVAEGDLLFELDREPYVEKLAAAQGQLAEAKASLNKYLKDVKRLEPLAEQRAIPLQDLDNAYASVEVGEAAVQSAEARVKSADLDLGYCRIIAPISGLIGARQVSVGSLVGKGEPTLLATISQLNPIWFYCNISEVEYLRAERKIRATGRRIGDLPVTLILADGSEHPSPGKWVFLDRAVDITTGTLRARAEFANPESLLRPGMFARVRISLKTDQPSLLVPQRAVQELQGKTFVWVVASDNTTSLRTVRAGPRVGSDWIIEEGLKPGERIVVEGVQKVREGATVQPMTEAQLKQLIVPPSVPGQPAPE